MQLKFVLESLLFSSQKPLSVTELRELLVVAAEQGAPNENVHIFRNVTEEQIRAALEELANDYELAQRSYRLVCVAGAWQFVTQPEYAPWLKVLVGVKPRPPRLSMPALETLAIVAYRQPITRAEIEQIRGVNVDGVLQTLLERGLIAPVGRAEVIGRPVLYGTTQLFLEYFGLRSLEDLPAADELRRAPSQGKADTANAQPGLATEPPEQLRVPNQTQPQGIAENQPVYNQPNDSAPAGETGKLGPLQDSSGLTLGTEE